MNRGEILKKATAARVQKQREKMDGWCRESQGIKLDAQTMERLSSALEVSKEHFFDLAKDLGVSYERAYAFAWRRGFVEGKVTDKEFAFKYKFEFVVVEVDEELPEEVVKCFKGEIKLSRIKFILDSLGRRSKTRMRITPNEVINPALWAKGFGFFPGSSWREVLGPKFCRNEELFNTAAKRLNLTCHTFKLLKEDPTFRDHLESEEHLRLEKTKGMGDFRSDVESKIQKALQNKGIQTIASYRGLRKSGRRFELDLFLPDMNIAFEFNGYYWHSSLCPMPKDKYYHREKTNISLENGIKLYHLWENDVQKIWNVVKSKTGIAERIGARKLSLSEEDLHYFFEENHLDGSTRAFKQIALKSGDEIICGLSLRKHPEGVEIARFASKKGIVVVGGFSRLLKFVLKNYTDDVVSYCNRDLTPDYRDSVYYKAGFKFLGDSGPILKYVPTKTITLNGKIYRASSPVDRQEFQKYKLVEVPGFSVDKTEREILETLGVGQVWNSGNWKFKLVR